jgi:ubiquinone/menaquinone biosynthesis C-methylase UbiE
MFEVMNEEHDRFCSSPEWGEYLRSEVIPQLIAGVELGDDMLEMGPGPGGATELLHRHVGRLTALEIDASAAGALADRFAGTNVSVVRGDCANTGMPDGSFDSVATFTMLHHIPTDRQQHMALAEAFRVLRAGGVLVGSDSLASDDLHHFHAGDTYNPVEPAWLVTQLSALGFHPITVSVGDEIRFTAHKPRRGEEEVGK